MTDDAMARQHHAYICCHSNVTSHFVVSPFPSFPLLIHAPELIQWLHWKNCIHIELTHKSDHDQLKGSEVDIAMYSARICAMGEK